METIALSDRDTVEAAEGVHLAQLAAGDRMSVQHYHVEPGARIAAHDHRHEQAGFVYAGALTFHVDGDASVVHAGESYVLRGGERHAVTNDGDDAAAGIDVFSPPRPAPDWAE